MAGLVWKDVLVALRDQWRYYAVLLGGMALLPFLDGAISAFPCLLALVMVLPLTSACAGDCLARWDRYAVSTPLGRSGVVAGKYLFAGFLSLAGLGLMGLYYPLWCVLTGHAALLGGLMGSAVTCALIFLLIDALLLPLSFWFGAERGSLGVSALGLPSLFLTAGTTTAAIGTANPFSVPLPLALGLAVILLPLSYGLSMYIWRRREL